MSTMDSSKPSTTEVAAHRGSIIMRLDMVRRDIKRIEQAKTNDERTQAAIDAQSALAHLEIHIDGILRAAGVEPLPDEQSE